MRFRNKIAWVLLFILLIALPISGQAATIFSDVSSNHWAKDQIARMAEKGIVKGVEDAKTLTFYFKPDNKVTHIEAIQMIYQTLKQNNKLVKEANSQTYATLLSTYKVPTWAHEAVSYALENKIISLDEAKNFIRNNQQTNARRVDVAVYIGKALNMGEDIDPLPVLNFKDSEMIIRAAVPYVDLLVKKGIVAGDTTNKFNPNNLISRAEMAALCAKTYDVLNTAVDISPATPTSPTIPQGQQSTQSSVISRTFLATNANKLVVKDDEEKIEFYDLKSNTAIMIDGRIKNASNLEIGQRVTLEFDKNNNLIKVEKKELTADFIGTVEKIVDYDTYYLITVKPKSTSSTNKNFKVYSSTYIELEGKKVSSSQLKVGNKIQVRSDNDKALDIYIESVDVTYDGILTSNVFYRQNPMIRIQTANNQLIELEIHKTVYIKKNGKKKDVEDLAKGDIISAMVTDGKVIDIIATSVNISTKDEGTIQTIAFGNPSQIVINNKDDEKVTYDISNSVLVEVDDKKATIYDLRPNYYVKIYLENGIITEIDAEKIESKTTFTGEVVRVYADYNRVTVRYLDSKTGNYEVKSVTVTSSTKIISTDGTSIRIGHLQTKDTIFVDGYEEDDMFIANRIIELN